MIFICCSFTHKINGYYTLLRPANEKQRKRLTIFPNKNVHAVSMPPRNH